MFNQANETNKTVVNNKLTQSVIESTSGMNFSMNNKQPAFERVNERKATIGVDFFDVESNFEQNSESKQFGWSKVEQTSLGFEFKEEMKSEKDVSVSNKYDPSMPFDF